MVIIKNYFPHSSRNSYNLDMCSLLQIPSEEYISSLFVGFLSSQTDCELVHLPVEEVPNLPWLVQDQMSSTQDSLRTGINSSCSFETPSWSHPVTQAQERMETPKDIEEIKSSLADLQSGMCCIYRMVGTSVNGNKTIATETKYISNRLGCHASRIDNKTRDLNELMGKVNIVKEDV